MVMIAAAPLSRGALAETAPADAISTIEHFNGALLAAMKSGMRTDFSRRFGALAPEIDRVFQLVVGFSRRENLATSGGGPGFSVGSIQPGKVQLSGGAEWLEARVGKRFPRNWGRRSLSNLSCRTFLSVAVVRRRS
jgi:hypothetical protein